MTIVWDIILYTNHCVLWLMLWWPLINNAEKVRSLAKNEAPEHFYIYCERQRERCANVKCAFINDRHYQKPKQCIRCVNVVNFVSAVYAVKCLQLPLLVRHNCSSAVIFITETIIQIEFIQIRLYYILKIPIFLLKLMKLYRAAYTTNTSLSNTRNYNINFNQFTFYRFWQ